MFSMGACVWRWYLWGATCQLDSCCWTLLLELCMHYICQRALPCLDYEFQIVPFKWGYKFIFAPGALSNLLYADKHRVQIVSNPLFWDKVQLNFGSSNPLFLDKKWRELLGAGLLSHLSMLPFTWLLYPNISHPFTQKLRKSLNEKAGVNRKA